jgi:murein L,D-transpeptidase YcbB/YkuD
MNQYALIFAAILMILLFTTESCKQKGKALPETGGSIPFDTALVEPFLKTYPLLKKYKTELAAIYRNYQYTYLWYDEKGTTEFANTLYSKVKNIEEEGISTPFPYQEKIDGIFVYALDNTVNKPDAELLITSLYLYYFEKVYKGIDSKTTTAIGWLLPRKKNSPNGLIDSMLADPKSPANPDQQLFSQYYRLQKVLKRYRTIEQNGGWKAITPDSNVKAYKPGDTAKEIQQIRERLCITGDLKQNSKSNQFDSEMVEAVKKYQTRNGLKPDTLITIENIREMNVPIGERIKTIILNMERCRWISPEIFNAPAYIFVNIPAYKLIFVRGGTTEFDSRVIVGESMTKTVIFAGKMSYLVFSPYWNLPKTIIENEVKPGMAKNRKYLALHHMEWNNGLVRQKPGRFNSLGLVKFMFPNLNEIYFHDTPSKTQFKKEDRAFSHGCVRVEHAGDFAKTILKDDKTWTPKKIDAAMNAGKESTCVLKNKIPVYIGYFTAWVDEQGSINFYQDVYDRDARLAMLLFFRE